MADLAYSYHNFIFPFIWQNSAENYKGPCFEEIKNNFENTHVWANDDLDDWHEIMLNDNDVQPDGLNVNKLKYATYQYYQPAIRNAIFGKWNEENSLEVVQSYYFTPIKNGDGINDKRAQYIIRKEIKNERGEYCIQEYCLNLTDIKLRLYNTGVGLLSFICENRITSDLADIKIINDYGRRITLPFIPKSDSTADSVCADSIDIYWDGISEDISQNFKEQILNINSTEKKADLNHIADFIINILNYSIGDDNNRLKKITTNKKDKEKEWYIQPALDDRMFVMCCVKNNFSQIFTGDGSVSAYDYFNVLKNDELFASQDDSYEKIEKSLYEFIFCDTPGNCTCYFPQMRQHLIRDHVYFRWIHPYWGTFYSVAAQAFMCITEPDFLINYFRTEYYEMACLVLVQRASLRVLQNKASSISAHIEDDDNTVNKNKRKEIANLQEKLIAFQNQINLYEISSQEQAIELYDMMREVFLVNKHTSILQEQLDGLYNIANIHQSNNISHWALVVAGAAIVIAMPSFFGDSPVWPEPFRTWAETFGDINGCDDNTWSSSVIVIKILVLIGICIYIWKQKNK